MSVSKTVGRGSSPWWDAKFIAGVAQLVEHFLAKEDVDSSNLFTRSNNYKGTVCHKKILSTVHTVTFQKNHY